MSKFDREVLLDHKAQSHIMFYLLKLSKLVNKNVYTKFAQVLKEEGYIKEN